MWQKLLRIAIVMAAIAPTGICACAAGASLPQNKEPTGLILEVAGKGVVYLHRKVGGRKLELTQELLRKRPVYYYEGDTFSRPEGSQAVVYYVYYGETLRYPPLKQDGAPTSRPAPSPHDPRLVGKEHWSGKGGRHMNEATAAPPDPAPRLFCSHGESSSYLFVPGSWTKLGVDVAWISAPSRRPKYIELWKIGSGEPLLREPIEPSKVESIECVHVYHSQELANVLRKHGAAQYRLRVVFEDGSIAERSNLSIYVPEGPAAAKLDPNLWSLAQPLSSEDDAGKYFESFDTLMSQLIKNHCEIQAGAQLARWWKRSQSAIAAGVLAEYGAKWKLPQLTHTFAAKLPPPSAEESE